MLRCGAPASRPAPAVRRPRCLRAAASGSLGAARPRVARRAAQPQCRARAPRRDAPLSDWAPAPPPQATPAPPPPEPARQFDERAFVDAADAADAVRGPPSDPLATALELLDAGALLGAAGGALAVLLTEQIAFAALPVTLPLLALIAGRAARQRREAASAAERAQLRLQLAALAAAVRRRGAARAARGAGARSLLRQP
jgi:hypothetical protein